VSPRFDQSASSFTVNIERKSRESWARSVPSTKVKL
jgi:hypothetical protein